MPWFLLSFIEIHFKPTTDHDPIPTTHHP